MSNKTIQIATSKEEVAYNLMNRIAKAEKLYDARKELLDLYSECLLATSGNRAITNLDESSQ